MKSKIEAACDEVKALLVAKNKSYGNSFAEPANVFAKGLTPEQQIYVRIDDKISRITKGAEYADEDTFLDLVGYLILLRVLRSEK